MVVTTDINGAEVGINGALVQGVTVAQGVTPDACLVRTATATFVLPGDVATVAALFPDSGGDVDAKIAAAIALEVIARNAAIAAALATAEAYTDSVALATLAAADTNADAAIAAAVDAGGYAPGFTIDPMAVGLVITAPFPFKYVRVENVLAISGVMVVDTMACVGTQSGVVGRVTLPATTTIDAAGGATGSIGADFSDVFPVIGIAASLGGTDAEITMYGQAPGFVAEFGFFLTIQV